MNLCVSLQAQTPQRNDGENLAGARETPANLPRLLTPT